ncbi:AAA family ATPase [Halomonas sp. THAF12]|uniref:AAA family ATPase n=1 Tax=Halomonas sp. B23F22_10 TaxID=3459515 RepID=UPI00373EE044
MHHRVVITGGPGGGKTSLIEAMEERGYPVVQETARRIIKERLAAGLSPRPDPVSFGKKILSSDIEKYQAAAGGHRAVFFDRGILDALYMLDEAQALTRDEFAQYVRRFPYSSVVFLLPPWEEIYAKDSERDQSLEEAVQVFEGMKGWYSYWGYETVEVPRVSVEARVAFVIKRIFCA